MSARTLRFSCAAAACCAVLLSGCGRHAGGEDESTTAADPVVAVETRAIESRTFEDLVTAPGQWRSGGENVLVAPFGATLDSLGPRIGDRIAAGQTVGWLVTRESEAALRGAELLAREARDEAGRAEARRALEIARRDLVRVPLQARRSGEVVRRSAEPGAQVAEGAEILCTVASEAVVFEAHVPAHDAARIRPGQAARILAPGRPPRRATVQRLLPAASAADQTALAWLAPDSLGATPELERFGSAAIAVGAPRRGPGVPDSALVEDDLTGALRIAVIGADGRAHWRVVTVGAGADGWHELASPALPIGTHVIVEGQRGLPDSTRVKPAS